MLMKIFLTKQKLFHIVSGTETLYDKIKTNNMRNTV